jgi:hypothetical protein
MQDLIERGHAADDLRHRCQDRYQPSEPHTQPFQPGRPEVRILVYLGLKQVHGLQGVLLIRCGVRHRGQGLAGGDSGSRSGMILYGSNRTFLDFGTGTASTDRTSRSGRP